MDGESEQVAIIDEPKLVEKLNNAKIVMAKSPASCSAILQPSDVGPFFKAVKKTLKHLNTDIWNDPATRVLLQEAFAIHDFSAAFKTKLINAVLKVNFVVQGFNHRDIISKGYQEIGMFPYDFSRVIGKCISKWTLNDVNMMKYYLPELTNIFIEKGKVEDADMDRFGILNRNLELYHCQTKDHLTLNRQRAMLLNYIPIIRERQDFLVATAKQREARAASAKRLSDIKNMEKDILGLTEEEKEAKRAEFYARTGYKPKQKRAPKRTLDVATDGFAKTARKL